jgi:hypothetical protein
MQHVKKRIVLAYQILVGAKSTALFATCAIEIAIILATNWRRFGATLIHYCRPKRRRKQPAVTKDISN